MTGLISLALFIFLWVTWFRMSGPMAASFGRFLGFNIPEPTREVSQIETTLTPEKIDVSGFPILQAGATSQPVVVSQADVGDAFIIPTQTQIAMQNTPTTAPDLTPTPQPTNPAWTNPGLTSAEEYCLDCSTYDVQVRITHYWPPDGEINCWDYNEETGWCDSALFSGLRWENYINIAAACPLDWPLGTWVEIPGVGTYNCLDRGTMVCFEGVCEVDILAPDLGIFDGNIYDARVYITWR